jgi:hypothetical protein
MDGLPLVVRAVQQYVGDPECGLVVGVYQRTTGAGEGVLMPPGEVVKLRDNLRDWVASRTVREWEMTRSAPAGHDALHLAGTEGALSIHGRHVYGHGDYARSTTPAALDPSSVAELAEDLTGWLVDNGFEARRTA